jgi:hypothetical protein
MPRLRRKSEIVRPSRLKLALRRQKRLLRPASLAIIGFGTAMLALALLHSAQTGGAVARLEKTFAQAIDLRVQDITIIRRNPCCAKPLAWPRAIRYSASPWPMRATG